MLAAYFRDVTEALRVACVIPFCYLVYVTCTLPVRYLFSTFQGIFARFLETDKNLPASKEKCRNPCVYGTSCIFCFVFLLAVLELSVICRFLDGNSKVRFYRGKREKCYLFVTYLANFTPSEGILARF